ncbi:septal ring lytic transglycosylase RlpA family protein [Legionella sp. W05-934-2]|jgi:rare lipoprotein A|uniref:septal ring lytic transglycosylase RlpA family protein n=1 Tax=Legionella sp. W05-934-2 TaxID=1198649 RepID=UPI00346316DB
MQLFLARFLIACFILLLKPFGFAYEAHATRVRQLKPVIPIDEPLSFYGNPITYKMDGNVYQVLKSSKGFHQLGIASWYGPDFHKKRTSSGEVYDMYAITAAHKTLPLPCYVKVTNLTNGRSIIVRVNDRGPFHTDRIIDLSYSAAYLLGIIQAGTAKVSVDAVSMANYADPVGEYFIHVASMSIYNNAKKLKKRLEKEFRWPVMMDQISDLYVITIGPFDKLAKLEQVRYQLSQIGFEEALAVIR